MHLNPLSRWLWIFAFAVATFLLGQVVNISAQMSDEEMLTGADARIEKHRKADLTITVLDAAGKPVPGATVALEQTRHAFLFGSNIFLWGRCGDEPSEAAYRARYAELLNYATLPFYWWSYESRRGEPEHERIEKIARWCQEHGIATKGHPLAWNYVDPRVAAGRLGRGSPAADGADRRLRLAFRRA